MLKWFSILFKKFKTVEELAAYTKDSPGLLGFWLSNGIRYVEDEKPEDEFRTAEETLKTKQGDCDDVAVLAYKVLKCWSIDGLIYGIRGTTIAHAVVVFQWKNKWCILDNSGFLSTNAKTPLDAVKKISQDWNNITEYDEHGKFKVITLK